jgi:hypothetical protein
MSAYQQQHTKRARAMRSASSQNTHCGTQSSSRRRCGRAWRAVPLTFPKPSRIGFACKMRDSTPFVEPAISVHPAQPHTKTKRQCECEQTQMARDNPGGAAVVRHASAPARYDRQCLVHSVLPALEGGAQTQEEQGARMSISRLACAQINRRRRKCDGHCYLPSF